MTPTVLVELRHARDFCAVADEQHFGRAATRLALSQPSLSVHDQLEAHIGARLDRHSRRVRDRSPVDSFRRQSFSSSLQTR